MAKKTNSLATFMTLSVTAAGFVGILVLAATNYQRPIEALIWAGITFIVALVGIATLALTVKDQEDDPNKPRLS